MAAYKNNNPFSVTGMNVTSPKGKALWCKVKEPERMFNAKGELATSLVCDPNDPAVASFIEKLEALRDKALEETKEALGAAKTRGIQTNPLFSEEFDKNDEPTGNIIIKTKMKNIDDRIERGQKATIDVVDAHRNVVDPVPLVGNGSVVRFVAYANPYYIPSSKAVGVTLNWQKLQIIDLVEYGTSGGGGDGFEDEEGFTASQAPATPPKADFELEDDDLDF